MGWLVAVAVASSMSRFVRPRPAPGAGGGRARRTQRRVSPSKTRTQRKLARFSLSLTTARRVLCVLEAVPEFPPRLLGCWTSDRQGHIVHCPRNSARAVIDPWVPSPASS
jgi:hypothetical protein